MLIGGTVRAYRSVQRQVKLRQVCLGWTTHIWCDIDLSNNSASPPKPLDDIIAMGHLALRLCICQGQGQLADDRRWLGLQASGEREIKPENMR